MRLIDSHCHLDFPVLAEDRAGVLARARAAGVARMVTICTKIDEFEDIAAIADSEADVYCSVGAHPNHAHEERERTVAEIVALAQHRKCVAIGEAGLDYHYDKAPRELAQRVLRTHIAAARQTGLPLVIHSRDADADMAEILAQEMGQGEFKALLHCFTSTRRLAETALKLGLYISFSGVAAFKNSEEIRQIAADVPMDRILVETDAPFLAPPPHRGRPNEPSFVVETARVLAKVKNMELEAFAEATTANFLKLFDKMPPLAA